jgi:hypothetical protein
MWIVEIISTASVVFVATPVSVVTLWRLGGCFSFEFLDIDHGVL